MTGTTKAMEQKFGAMSVLFTDPVAGVAPIGCDMEEVRSRPFEEWRDLLGMSGIALAGMAGPATGEPFAHAATRVWSAREAVSKLGVTVLRPRLVLERFPADAGWLVLRHGTDLAWTTVVEVDGGDGPRPIVFAFAQKAAAV